MAKEPTVFNFGEDTQLREAPDGRLYIEDRDGNPKTIDSLSTEQASINGQVEIVTKDSNWSGSNGGEMIQSAIDAVGPDSEVWVVGDGPDNPGSAPESGVWEVSSHIAERPPDNLTIRGLGKPLLFNADDSEDDIIRTDDDTSSDSIKNFRLEGLRFDGNAANQNYSGNQPISSEFYHLANVRIVNCDGYEVENCILKNATGYFIEAKVSEGGRVRNIRGTNTANDDAISITDDLKGNSTSRRTIVDNIYVTDVDDAAVEIEKLDGDVVVSNILTDNGNVTVESCKRVTVSNIVIPKDTGTGLRFAACQDVSASNLVLLNQSAQAILFRGGTMEDISVSDFTLSGRLGIRFRDNSTFNNISISNGEITCTEDSSFSGGIALTEGAVQNTRVSNVYVDVAGNSLNGIRVHSGGNTVSDVALSNLVVENAKHAGVAILENGNALTNVVIDNVISKNNGQDTSANDRQRSGIQIESLGSASLTDVIVRGVRTYDDQGTKTQQYGIYRSGADYCIYDDCNLRGNATGATGGTLGTNSQEGIIIQ